MADKIVTLAKKEDPTTAIYPNVVDENIPSSIQRKLTAGDGVFISDDNTISNEGVLNVTVTQSKTSGTEIASIEVDGSETKLYSSEVSVNQTQSSGTEVASITVDSSTTSIYSPITAKDISLELEAMYDETFENNSWEQIQEALAEGNPMNWALGSTKSLTLTDGSVYTLRLCDLKSGRYQTEDGTKSNGVLEFVECYTTSMTMNSPATNVGGWASSLMRSTNIQTIWKLLPDDFKAICLKVGVSSTKGGGSYNSEISTSYDQIWLPSEVEIFNGTDQVWYSSTTNIMTCFNAEDPNNMGQFELYANNGVTGGTSATQSFSQKHKLGSTSSIFWWLRSPSPNGSVNFCIVYNYGIANLNYASNSNGIAPCFAV